jgi:hypothetical protein
MRGQESAGKAEDGIAVLGARGYSNAFMVRNRLFNVSLKLARVLLHSALAYCAISSLVDDFSLPVAFHLA